MGGRSRNRAMGASMTAAEALDHVFTWVASLYGIAVLTAAGLVVGVLLSRGRK